MDLKCFYEMQTIYGRSSSATKMACASRMIVSSISPVLFGAAAQLLLFHWAALVMIDD